MKKSLIYLGVICGSVVIIIGTFTLQDTFASDDKRPEIVKEAREHQKSNSRKETKIDTIDVYDEGGDYVITVPVKLWTKHQEKDISFWKNNREKFIKEYDLPKEDPQGEINWNEVEDPSKNN